MQQELRLDWVECPSNHLDLDELKTMYKSHEIRLIIPNGGIIGVSVKAPGGKCYEASSEHLKRYHDEAWHINEAKAFIDSFKPKQFVILYQMGKVFSAKVLPSDVTLEQAEDIVKEETRRAYKNAVAEQCTIVADIRLIEADLWEHKI